MPQHFFHRAARVFPQRPPEQEIVLAVPPALPAPTAGPAAIMQLLIPLLGSLGSLVFVVIYHNPLMFVASGTMMAASVGGGVFIHQQQRRSRRLQQASVRGKYRRYLDGMAQQLRDVVQRQHATHARLAPDPNELLGNWGALWERRTTDDDFLIVRFGTGVAPLSSPLRLDLGANPMTDYDPELLANAQSLVGTFAQLEAAPMTVKLRGAGSLVLHGAATATRALLRAILCQVLVAHAPDDVRIFLLCAPEARNAWGWLKWAPHVRRLRTTTPTSAQEEEHLCLLTDAADVALDLVKTQIMPEIERRRKLSEGEAKNAAVQHLPHLLFVIDGIAPATALARLPLLGEMQSQGAALGISWIWALPERGDEPPHVRTRLTIAPTGWTTSAVATYGGEVREYLTADQLSIPASERIARALAPFTLGEQQAQQELAEDIRLLQMPPFALADLALDRWPKRVAQDLLRVPIGIGPTGEPLLIDLKEAASGGMGPHGMMIGATGSGKSELLRTIIASLAMTHDPETLNFVLADFKGGAAFAELARLPHAAGLVTNLQADLTLADRVKTALFGEQDRRQRMLRDAGNLDNIGQYQAKRRQQPAMEPLPYLLIVVDEFAELLSSRPDFLDLFIAIGRLGRSLGMHLLLATQRLSEGRIQGLEGHLRYRICLRTFNAAESSLVLGKPDAYYLPSYPGIGYFKVDTDIYTRFKAAVISLPIAVQPPQSAVQVRQFTTLGGLKPLVSDNDKTAVKRFDPGRTELDLVVQALARRGGTVHQVWLPPLGSRLALATIFAQAGLNPGEEPLTTLQVPVGQVDHPGQQAQPPLVLDLAGTGGHVAIVGAPQSGKSTALRTIITALCLTYAPHEVQCYVIDYGGGTAYALEDAPHICTVCLKGDNAKIRRTLRQIHSIIEERQALYRERKIEHAAGLRAWRRQHPADPTLADVFLVIDNLFQVQQEIDQIDAELIEFAATGLNYGVHLVVASNRWVDIKQKLRDSIATRIELRLNDPAESEIGKAPALAIPAGVPGRALLRGGVQAQFATLAAIGQSESEAIRDLVAALRHRWPGEAAPRVRLLPALVQREDIPGIDQQGLPGVVLGIDEFQLAPLAVDLFASSPHFLIFGDTESGKTTLLRTWIEGIIRRYNAQTVRYAIVDMRRMLIDLADTPHALAYACTAPMLKSLIDRIKAEFDPRLQANAQLTLEALRAPQSWEGSRCILFVDDYESLVAGNSNPLSPLLDDVAQGRDIGFHLVLARRVAGTARTAFEPFFQRVKETGSAGIILNGDAQEGPLLGTQRAQELPPGRGFLVRRNQRTIMMQILFPGIHAIKPYE